MSFYARAKEDIQTIYQSEVYNPLSLRYFDPSHNLKTYDFRPNQLLQRRPSEKKLLGSSILRAHVL